MEFSAFVDGLDFPMYVVTVAKGDEQSGCLVGFGSQVSLKPPRFLACISVANHTHSVAMAADLLAVHLLSEEQHDLAELFGSETGDEIDKFERCSWQAGPGGVPLLDDCPRVLVGRVRERLNLGDHTGFLLDPVSVSTRDGEPGLTFHDVQDVDPGHPV
jgi:flavin reductase (DIM6/NTAB) family NADH-FMN oxidoreductase RutF